MLNSNFTRRFPLRAQILTLAVIGFAVTMVSCYSDPATGPSSLGKERFIRLTVNPHALTIPVSSSHTVQVVGTTLEGQNLPIQSEVRYVSTDTNKLHITSAGVATARRSGTTTIIASVVRDGISFIDTVMVTITDASRTLAGFSADLPATDSTRLGTGASKTIRGYGIATTGDTIRDLAVDYRSTNPQHATVNRSTGVVTAISPGTTKIIASATSYGTSYADTVDLTITAAVTALVIISEDQNWMYWSDNVTIAVNGTVQWNNGSGTFDASKTRPFSMTFDSLHANIVSGNSADPMGGNIPQFTTGYKYRKFTAPGVYTYTVNETGQKARIVAVQ